MAHFATTPSHRGSPQIYLVRFVHNITPWISFSAEFIHDEV